MPRQAKNPSLVQRPSKVNSRTIDNFDDEELLDTDLDRDELAALTTSQGRSPVMLSSDDALYG